MPPESTCILTKDTCVYTVKSTPTNHFGTFVAYEQIRRQRILPFLGTENRCMHTFIRRVMLVWRDCFVGFGWKGQEGEALT
jgi:hypothetical protein